MAPKPKVVRTMTPAQLLKDWKRAEFELEHDPEYIEMSRVVMSRRVNRTRHKARREHESWRIRTGFHWLSVVATIAVIVILAGNYWEGNWHTIQDLIRLSDMAHFGLMWLTWGTTLVITMITRLIPNE